MAEPRLEDIFDHDPKGFDPDKLLAMDDGEYADYDDFFNDEIIHRGSNYNRHSGVRRVPGDGVGEAPMVRTEHFSTRGAYDHLNPEHGSSFFSEVRVASNFGGSSSASDDMFFACGLLVLIIAGMFYYFANKK